MSKRKFMAMIEDFGIPLNLDARDFIQSFRFLSELRGFRVYKDIKGVRIGNMPTILRIDVDRNLFLERKALAKELFYLR